MLSGWSRFHDHACIETTVNVFRIRTPVSTMAPLKATHKSNESCQVCHFADLTDPLSIKLGMELE